MLLIVASAIARSSSLFAVVCMSGVFSLLAAMLFIVLDAADVAFTEAAVGAGVSTVLGLATLALTKRSESRKNGPQILPLVVVLLTGATLVYGTIDMPNFGSADAPAQLHLAPDYIKGIPMDIHIPNMVTAILASYRGFDTLGETAVVFTAGIGVLSLLVNMGRRRKEHKKDGKEISS
tara:strand:+ start:578 stop:1111 length:534 start_codon:yes stop_codon:yes gene_type:complete